MLVNTTSIRTNYRVENGVPDTIIQRYIDKVEDDFVRRFGSIFTDVVADPTTYADEARLFTRAIEYLVMCNLLGENFVVTGFGVVVKKDEFSDNIDYEATREHAKQYAKDAVYSLNSIAGITEAEATLCVQEMQGFTEGFFKRRSPFVTLAKYFPWFNLY